MSGRCSHIGRRHSQHRCVVRCNVDVKFAVIAAVGVGLAVVGDHEKIVGDARSSGDERGLRQLGGSDPVRRFGRHNSAIDDEVAAAGVRGVVIEVIGQGVAVGVGRAEQA